MIRELRTREAFASAEKACAVLVAALCAGATAFAQSPPVPEAPGERLALVIGNAAYEGDAALRNPVNDATDMAAALTEIGWKVQTLTDADRRAFTRGIASFRDALSKTPNSSALFFYAGHAMQADGRNYLLPVKTRFENLDDVKLDAVNLDMVTEAIEQGGARVSVIILDSCRDNPFAKTMTRSLGGSRGLTVVQSGGGAKGSAIMFSTSPGDVALDGEGRNGIFTSSLLAQIKTDAKIEDLFRAVNAEVRRATSDAQKPWINASLSSDFYFVSDAIRSARAAEAARSAEELRQAELRQAAEEAALRAMAEAEERAGALREELEAARAAAALNRQADAEAVLAKAKAEAEIARLEAELSRPKGKARIESGLAGKVFAGDDYLGEIGPDSPLMIDSLAPGSVKFRFIASGGDEESKEATVTERAYVTVLFGPARTGSAPGSQAALAVLALRRDASQLQTELRTQIRNLQAGEPMRVTKENAQNLVLPAGMYELTAQLPDDIEPGLVQTVDLRSGGLVSLAMPVVGYSKAFKIQRIREERSEVERRYSSAARAQKTVPLIGKIVAGVGLAGLGAAGYFLYDGLSALMTYNATGDPTTAVRSRARAQEASILLSYSLPISAGVAGLSLPMLLADYKLERFTDHLKVFDEQIRALGATP